MTVYIEYMLSYNLFSEDLYVLSHLICKITQEIRYGGYSHVTEEGNKTQINELS